MRRATLFLLFFLPTLLAVAQDAFLSSGDADIDAVRREVVTAPTDADNFRERSVLLYVWMAALQQQGADLSSFYPIDTRYYQLEGQINRSRGDERAELTRTVGTLIDEGFAELETIQNRLLQEGPVYTAYESDGADFPTGGNMEADWPMFQANEHNNGYTDAPGPRYGRRAWTFPIGLGWYSRPVVDSGHVYLASPGMRITGFCLDLATGRELWTSTQQHPLLGVYKYPAIMSTPVLQGNRVVLREVNSHGGNNGQAKNLVYLDKQTGRTLERSYAGHIDYRTRNAPVAARDSFVVYPFGVADIYGTPAVCQNFNRLICKDASNQRLYWDFNVGDIDALAEPVLTADRAYQGTMEGYLYALNLRGGRGGEPLVAWNFRAEGAINTAVLVRDGRVYFGANDGRVYCLDEATGSPLWSTAVETVERKARKHFSTPVLHAGRLYLGGADRQLHCLDAATGTVQWQAPTDDWLRASPLVTDREVYAADVSGMLYRFDPTGRRLDARRVSDHPVYADLVLAGDRILLNDSHLMTYCLDLNGEEVWRHSILRAHTDETGERIFTDQLSGGTYYQSKPTAADGLLYFGNPAGFLYAVDAATGREAWKFEMGGAISVGPAIQDGKVYAGQQGGERFFYCLDAKTGELVWKQTVPGGWVWGSATVDDGLVYVPTVNGYAVCLNGQTGHIVWMYPTAKSVPAEPAVDGDLVYFGSWSRSLYAFDKKTGQIVWKANGVGLDSGTLIAEDGKIYLPHHDNIFMYFDARTGEILTEGNTDPADKGNYTNFNASPAFHDGRGFFTARVGIGLRGVPLTSRVYCVDAETAAVHWTFPDGGGLSAPALASGRVYVGSGNYPFLYALDQVTGQPAWIYRMGNRIEESTLCIYRDKLYALSGDGYLHAIE